MKKLVRISLVSLMAFVMLISSGCGTNSSNQKATATPTPASQGAVNGTYTRPGEVYKFWSWQFASADPYQGDSIRDQAMRKRVQSIQDDLGIDIQFVPNTGDMFTAVRQSSFQGTPVVDGMKEGGLNTFIATYLYQDVPGACLEPLSDHAYVYDFNNTNKFNVSVQNDLMTFNNKLWYFVPIEIGLHFECTGQVLVFNKRLVTEAGYTPEKLYGWFEDGTWTWDKFESVLVASTKKEKGQWGIEHGNSSLFAWALINSNEGKLVDLQVAADGTKQDYFVASQPNTVAAYDEFIKLVQDSKCVDPTYYGSVDQTPLNNFMSGKTAFMFTGYSTNSLDKIAKMSEDYGILPVPKGPASVKDKNQYSSLFPHVNPYAVFRGVQNTDGTIEVLAKLFQPIYDANSDEAKQLLTQEKDLFTRDDESKKVLDVTEANKVLFRDFMYVFAKVGDSSFDHMVFYEGETSILNREVTPKAYFDSITDVMNAAIVANSPYTWQ